MAIELTPEQLDDMREKMAAPATQMDVVHLGMLVARSMNASTYVGLALIKLQQVAIASHIGLSQGAKASTLDVLKTIQESSADVDLALDELKKLQEETMEFCRARGLNVDPGST